MSEVLTLRIPSKAAGEVRQIAKRERRSVSEVGARMVEEWLRMEHFPYIEFRAFNGERTACVKGRLQVWQVIMIAKHYQMDSQNTADHLVLSREQVEGAFQYYRAYTQEIDQAFEENNVGYDRLKQMFPDMVRFTIDLRDESPGD